MPENSLPPQESQNLQHPFFSIIMPVYNTEVYVAETLDSILQQDADLLERTEIIIINDGSPDNSEAVCLEYAQKYPQLIRYILQENQGVSAARNRGISEARGELIGFMDSDDKYDPACFKAVYNFWQRHSEEVDVISIPLVFFDGLEGEHPLNFKFKKGTRVIDIESEFDSILLHIGGSFIRREAFIETGLRFESGIKYSEDKLLLTRLIGRRQRYGVLQEPPMYYRKRVDQSSAVQSGSLDRSWYIDTLQKVDARLAEEFVGSEGLPRYVQYVIAYDLQWRVKQKAQHVLNPVEEQNYLALFKELLGHIDNSVIMALRNIFTEHKAYLIKLKTGTDPLQVSEYDKGVFTFEGAKLAAFTKGKRFSTIELLEYSGSVLTLHGYFFGLPFKGIEFGYFIDSDFMPVKTYAVARANVTFLGDIVFDRNVYKIDIPIKAGMRIRPGIRRPDGTLITGTFLLKNLSYLPEGETSYRQLDASFLLQNVRNSYLAIKENTFYNRARLESAFLKNTLKNGTRKLYDLTHGEVLRYRASANVARTFKSRKKIWLISDRPDSAGDNGEAFFEYVVKHCPAGVKPYFVLSQTSADYPRLSEIGTVVDPRTDAYKKLFLRADKVISSQADDYVINPFGRDQNYFRDLYSFDFVFLQHGITLHNVSSWLHHFAKNIKVFTTAAVRERKSIVEGSYGYTTEDVVLTGFPRHDKLIDCKQKKIVVAPTWRHWLAGVFDPKTLTASYNEDFKESDFYKFYQGLMTSPRLNKALEDYGYIAEFLIHPSFNQQIGDFIETDYFKLSVPPHNYSKAFAEAALMVTDYSSVAFDFAYLRKPVVYSQFDVEAFYEGHPWGKSYYSFEEDGFGPVVREIDELIDSLVSYIERDCELEPEYLKRVDDFFAFQDHNSSQRLLKEILTFDTRK